MQAEIVNSVPTPSEPTAPTPVEALVEAVPTPVVTDSSPVAEITPIAGGEEVSEAAPAELAGGAKLEGGRRKYRSRSRADKSRPHHAGRKCPSGTLRVSKRRKGDGHWVKVCSKSKWLRRRRLSGGEDLEGGRRRRRSRSRR
jgi:hypothetical protein